MFVRLLVVASLLSVNGAVFAQDEGIPFPEDGNIPREQPIRHLDQKGVFDLQKELIRARCFAGPANGVWTRSSHEALMDFNINSGVGMASVDPDIEALKHVQETPGAVCPGRPLQDGNPFPQDGLQ